MIAKTVLCLTFPWGRYHGTPWGRHVNEGAVDWPPSPWRVLRALYSTWKDRCPQFEEADVHALLERLQEPPSYVVPPALTAHTRHWVPDVQTRGSSDRYKIFDTSAVFSPEQPVLVCWDVALTDAERDVLDTLAQSLSYIGRAESICDARVICDVEIDERLVIGPAADDAPATVPVLTVDPPLRIEGLVAAPQRLRKQGLTMPPGACWRAYVRPEPARPRVPERPVPARARPTLVRLVVDSPALPSIRSAVAVGDVLRSACIKASDPRLSATFAGKDAVGTRLTGHRHAHYLALDDDGDRLIDHLLVWAPGGFDDGEVAALSRLRYLRAPRGNTVFQPMRVAVEAVGDIAPVSASWTSLTPFAPPRHRKPRDSWDQFVEREVRRELVSRGHPEPVRVEIRRSDSLTFRRYRLRQQINDACPASHVRVEFEEPVEGPLAVGALSHFGLGLLVPR